MNLTRIGKHILILGTGVLLLGAGTAYSLFTFKYNVSDTTPVTPTVDNIRQNFIFGEDGDVVYNEIPEYTVRFHAQCTPGQTSEGSYYDTGVGYSRWFGYFDIDQVAKEAIEELGGTITPAPTGSGNPGTWYNCITFEGVDAITQTMLSTIGNPLCSDPNISSGNLGSISGLIDLNGGNGTRWALSWISWAVNIDEQKFGDLYSVPERQDDAGWHKPSNLGYSDEGVAYVCEGRLPSAGYEIPNFNLPLSEYATGYVLDVYPIYSDGKDYGAREDTNRDDYHDPNNTMLDCISINFDGGGSCASRFFSFDEQMTEMLHQDIGLVNSSSNGERINYVAYRLPGLLIDGSEGTITIRNDVSREYNSWIGTGHDLLANGYFRSYRDYDDDRNNYDDNVEAQTLNLTSLGEGRYNVYLFVKERSKDSTVRAGLIEDPEIPFYGSDDTLVSNGSAITSVLNEMGIFEAYSATLGYGTWTNYYAYDTVLDWGIKYDYMYHLDFRSYYIYVERTHDLNMVGGYGSNPTWGYQERTEVKFYQNPEASDQYEAQGVNFYENVTSTKTLYDTNGNELGTLTLPSIYFSVMLDEYSGASVQPVNLDYDQNGNLLTQGVPTVTLREPMTGAEYHESYASSRLTNGTIDFGSSLFLLKDYYSDGRLAEINANQGGGQVLFTPAGSNESMPLGNALADGLPGLRGAIDQSNIIAVPSTGQFNFFVDIDFNSAGGTIVKMYYYRIDREFVLIVNGDVLYRNDGYVDVDPASYSRNGIETYSLANYTTGMTLSATDVFLHNGTDSQSHELLDVFDLISADGTRRCLMDIYSGRYITPWSLNPANGAGFTITKNHLLTTVVYDEAVALAIPYEYEEVRG